MFESLALGTIWLWLALFVVAALVTVLVESEKGFWATVTLIATVIAFQFGLKFPIFGSIAAHPWKTAGGVGIYFAAGICWGVFKWFLFLNKKSAHYNEIRQMFLEEKGVTELTPALALELAQSLESGRGVIGNHFINTNGVSAEPPPAREHKGDIMRWMSYWPFSIVGTILNDFVRKAWTHIYNFMVGTYDRISTYVFRNYAGDVALAKQGLAVEKAAKEAETDNRRRR